MSRPREVPASDGHGLTSVDVVLLSILPPAILSGYGVLLALPSTRRLAIALVQENRPVELVTFFFLLAGGLRGLAWVRRAGRMDGHAAVRAFYLFFCLGLIVVAMEEIAWGQALLGFSTPEAVERVNRQDEITLHNIGALQGRSEVFRMVFGFAGLLGIWLNGSRRLSAIAVPPVLWPWFATISLAALLDLHADIASVSHAYDRGWRWASEVVEMLIGGAALLYLLLKERESRVRPGRAQTTSAPAW